MLEGLRGNIEEVIDEKWFPFAWLLGFSVLDAFTSDFLWLIIAILGFVLFLFKGRRD